ncbi:hypothetical protein HK096_003342 [Nowakowskiella sp. JEL0078]|nr:hypothetical protein HK096_003342 [Nowakowskiella sp. JEL0078]
MIISAPASGLATDPGVGVRLSSTSYITMGSVATIRLRTTYAGGIVTAFITMADDKDEIDWEWTGAAAYLGQGQSNFFSKGLLEYTNSQKHYPGSNTGAQPSATLYLETHEYSIDWNSERLNWLVDGVIVRTSTAAALGSKYPTSAARVSFAVWDGGYGTATSNTGTREWAGGFPNWNGPVAARTAVVEWVKIRCSGDVDPTTTPKRPTGFYAPYIYAPAVGSVVPGVFGYDANYVGPGKKSLANLATELALNPASVVKNSTSGSVLVVNPDGSVSQTKNSSSSAISFQTANKLPFIAVIILISVLIL